MTQVGEITLLAKIDTSNYKQGAKEIDKANSDIAGSADSTEKKSNSAFNSIAKVGLAAVAAAAVAAGAVIVKNFDNAISRVDTLNNFSKVMANLGYGADEARSAIKKLDKGVRGLPTSLDSIVSAMQNISPATKSLDQATDLTLALNNALLAGGKSADIQATGMEQFSQAIAKGKPDMMEWRSLATAMPGQLKQISNSLGFENWQKMADAVSDGSLSFDKVKEAIVSLNKDGLANFPSFAEQAKNATGGLSTGIAQMNTAITRGIAGVIQAIGSDKIVGALSNIGKGFESALKQVVSFVGFVSRNDKIFGALAVGLGTAVTAITAWYVAVKVATAAQWAWNVALNANPIGVVIVAVAALIGAIVYLYNNVKSVREAFSGMVKFWKDEILPVLKIVGDYLKGEFKSTLDSLKQSWNEIYNATKPYHTEIKAFAEFVGKVLIGIIIVLGAALLGIIVVISNVIEFIGKAVAAYIKLGAAIENFRAGAQRAVDDAWKAIWNFVSNIGGMVGNLGNVLFGAGRSLVTGFIDGIKSAIGAVKDTLSNLTSKLPDWKGPMSLDKTILRNSGKAVIQGFIGGLESQYSNVQSSLSGITSSLTPSIAPIESFSQFDNPGSEMSSGGSNNMNVSINLSGIMTDSTSGIRQVGKQIVRALNDELKSKQQPLIGGGAI